MSSNLIGNVIAGFVFKYNIKQSTLFIIFTIMAVLGSLMFCLLKKPKKVNEKGKPLIDTAAEPEEEERSPV